MPEVNLTKINQDIVESKRFWYQRNIKFQEWYEILLLTDQLASKGMETYVSNEPMTFYNMAHFLLTKGDISHTTPIENESALELDRRARVNRGCEYMWKVIDQERQRAGDQPFIDELSFFLLVLGWYSTVSAFNPGTGQLNTQIWNPFDVYPRYANNRMVTCVHSYKITEQDLILKAEENRWDYTKRGTPSGEVVLDDYFYYGEGGLHNIILVDGKNVTDWVSRPNMQILAAPVGGFPDKGSLTSYKSSRVSNSRSATARRDWRRLTGRGIFEVNEEITSHFNKWRSMVTQILRDTAQPITQEFSSTPQATPEQLRERGALFHYAPGELGIQRVPPPVIPAGIQNDLAEDRREVQKGSFSDAVFGMMEGGGRSGYSLSLLASSSANQILYPYMDGKHFVISEHDRFWLSNTKKSNHVFQIKGKFMEKLEPEDIPEDVSIDVSSRVATPKDWLERSTIANMLKDHLDEATINTVILELDDPQGVKRRRDLDAMLNHPMSQMVKLISGYYSHADYLDKRGDSRQAGLFRRAAQSLEAQLGVPPPGQGKPEDMSRVQAERTAGAPEERTKVAPEVAPPEERGFSPAQLRQSIGTGSLKAVGGR